MILIKLRIMSRIESKTATTETAYDDNRACGGGSDAEMGGLIMQQCDCGDCDSYGYAGNVGVDVDLEVACSQNRQDSM